MKKLLITLLTVLFIFSCKNKLNDIDYCEKKLGLEYLFGYKDGVVAHGNTVDLKILYFDFNKKLDYIYYENRKFSWYIFTNIMITKNPEQIK